MDFDRRRARRRRPSVAVQANRRSDGNTIRVRQIERKRLVVATILAESIDYFDHAPITISVYSGRLGIQDPE